jgi:membrane peptidoglycan carboxypeptidase
VHVGLATVDATTGELLAFYPGQSWYDDAIQAQIEPGSQMQAFSLAALVSAPLPPTAVAAGLDPEGTAQAQALWTLMGKTGLTQNLIADLAELPEPLAKLKQDPELSLGIAPESPARMAAAFGIFADDGTYHPFALALSVTDNGNTVWTYKPASTQTFRKGEAARIIPTVEFKYSGGSYAAPENTAFGLPGTIGGDLTAWYSGYDANIVTSVGIWDEVPIGKGRVAQRSLGGLGGVPASDSAQLPASVWSAYMGAVTTGSAPTLEPSGGRAFAALPPVS